MATTMILSKANPASGYQRLYTQIKILPKEMQDMIHEFNVDHRPIMKQICKEIFTAHKYRLFHFTFDSFKCDNCHCKNKEIEYDIVKCLGIYFIFCGDYCEYDQLQYVRKLYYTSRVRRPYKKYKDMIQYIYEHNDND